MIADELVEAIKRWRLKPSTMVRELFKAEPDAFQKEALDSYQHVPRIAMKAARGPGKTASMAWIGWHFLITRERPVNCAATSISGDNLRDGLVKEMALWREKSPLLLHWFDMTSERVFERDNPKTKFLSFRTWSKTASKEQLGATLAGLHADHMLFLIDETGAMPAEIPAAAEAGFSTAKECHIIQAGNTNTLEGALYAACVKHKHLWKVIQITGDPDDPNRSKRMNLAWCKEMIDIYGRDDPYVQVMILGQWPKRSMNALLGPDDVEAAFRRKYQEHDIAAAPRILGVDVARDGDDKCFDDITEVLTNEGWKPFSALDGHEKVLSVPPNGKEASWQPIDEIHCYDFDGKMNLLEKKHLNFCVTDNHNLLVRRNPKSDLYKLAPYKSLPREFLIREESSWSGTSPETISFRSVKAMPHGGVAERQWDFSYRDWATLLGWFVSEGSVYQERRHCGRLNTSIAQNPGKKQEEIKELLMRMGIRHNIATKKNALLFSINPIGRYLLENCGVGAPNKRVPAEIKNGSPETIRAFLDAFLKGDGTCNARGKGRTYTTSSPGLADDIQEMLAKLGCAGTLRRLERKGSTFLIEGRVAMRGHDTFLIYERSNFSGKTVRKRDVQQVHYTGKIWCVSTRFKSIYVRRAGVPMWSGNSVIFPRQGLVAFKPHQMRNVRSDQGAGQVARVWADWDVNAVFVDNTGGFGAGWIDQLRLLGREAIPVGFAEAKNIDKRYFNRRAEMYFKMAQWIKDGGALPHEPELIAELTETTYTFKGDRLLLEPKDVVKAKIQRSPDLADALALTFAAPVAPRNAMGGQHRLGQVEGYDPFAEFMRRA
jgi:LAGLIDADG-like domain